MNLTPKKLEAQLKACNEALALEPEIRAVIMARKPKSLDDLRNGGFEPKRMKTVAFKLGHRDGRHAIGDAISEAALGEVDVSLAFLGDGPFRAAGDDSIAPVADACATFDEAYDAGVEHIMSTFQCGLREHIEFKSHDLEVQKKMASWSPTTSCRPKH